MPTSSRNRRRSSISRSTSRAMWRSVSVSVDRVEPVARAARRERAELVDRACPPTQHRERLRPQPRAVAVAGTAARSCTPRSSRAGARSRSRGSGAGGSGRCPRSAPRRRARARSGCGSAPRPARRRCRRGRSSRCASGQLAPGRLDVDLVALGERRRSSGRSRPSCSPPRARARPRAIDSSGSGTTSSGSISSCAPRPVQCWHIPCGALNEKIRGSSSGIEVPHVRHANFSEKVSVSPSSPPARRRASRSPASPRRSRRRAPPRSRSSRRAACARRRASRAGRRRPRCRA